MVDFEGLAQELASARAMLKGRVDALEGEVAKIKKSHLPAIRRWAENAAEKQALLKQVIEEHPECFMKPKSMILHGIRFGYQKGKGAIEWDDDAIVIKLIKKHFPEQSEILIKTTEKPVKKALGQLTVDELKKIGVTVESTGDEVFIKFTETEIDKIVNAILAAEETE